MDLTLLVPGALRGGVGWPLGWLCAPGRVPGVFCGLRFGCLKSGGFNLPGFGGSPGDAVGRFGVFGLVFLGSSFPFEICRVHVYSKLKTLLTLILRSLPGY